jgi:cell division GTPase FtsZ
MAMRAPRPPISKILLAPLGAGGSVNAARVATLRNIAMLKAVVSGLKTAIVAVGLGGGTGSAVAPILARLARDKS